MRKLITILLLRYRKDVKKVYHILSLTWKHLIRLIHFIQVTIMIRKKRGYILIPLVEESSVVFGIYFYFARGGIYMHA